MVPVSHGVASIVQHFAYVMKILMASLVEGGGRGRREELAGNYVSRLIYVFVSISDFNFQGTREKSLFCCMVAFRFTEL